MGNSLVVHWLALWLSLQRSWFDSWSLGFPDGSEGKGSSCNVGDTEDVGLIHGLERSPGGRNGNPLQYSCPGNPRDRETDSRAHRLQ